MALLKTLKDLWYSILNSCVTIEPIREQLGDSKKVALAIIFLTNMLDNLLLTSVVPIIPAFLLTLDKEDFYSTASNSTSSHRPLLSPHEKQVLLTMNDESFKSHKSHAMWANITGAGPNWTSSHHHGRFPLSAAAFSENGRVGWLLSSKAIVQLFANCLVGPLCNKFGYTIFLFSGTVILLMSSIVFAIAESYVPLFIARAIQGLGSAAAVISGMSIVANRFPEDKSRSRAMGIALGGAALGILIGYPFGGIIYSFIGKTVVFLVLGGFIFIDLGLQWFVFGLNVHIETYSKVTPVYVLLRDKHILIATGVICLTTMSMSVLEPTVPLWAMSFMKVKNWELGFNLIREWEMGEKNHVQTIDQTARQRLIFLPDSIGYFIGTNCFGEVSQRIGRWYCCVFCILLIALCQICLPFATSIPQLILPHFGLGLGLGITDAAIMPLLALLVDVKNESFYGCVYAVAQLAVCLAYSVGPFAAGMIIKEVGFPWLMRGMAILNILFSPLCFILSKAPISLDEDKPLTKSDIDNKYYTQEKEIDEACFKYGHLIEDDD
ncbi:synaptic vesicular amine transporter [Biomphalaria glabrata]